MNGSVSRQALSEFLEAFGGTSQVQDRCSKSPRMKMTNRTGSASIEMRPVESVKRLRKSTRFQVRLPACHPEVSSCRTRGSIDAAAEPHRYRGRDVSGTAVYISDEKA